MPFFRYLANSLIFSIFADLAENNLLGNGQRVGLKFEYGPVRSSITLSFDERWLFGVPLSFNASIFYYYYQQNSLEGVQKDYWKLILPHKCIWSYVGVDPGKDGWPGKTVSFTITEAELYDLRRDPGERYSVASVNPEIVSELQALASEARQDLGDDNMKVTGANRRKPGSVK
jgi:hypothetical protein